jgi:hypothetical protein
MAGGVDVAMGFVSRRNEGARFWDCADMGRSVLRPYTQARIGWRFG